jgi:hypothetical protein
MRDPLEGPPIHRCDSGSNPGQVSLYPQSAACNRCAAKRRKNHCFIPSTGDRWAGSMVVDTKKKKAGGAANRMVGYLFRKQIRIPTTGMLWLCQYPSYRAHQMRAGHPEGRKVMSIYCSPTSFPAYFNCASGRSAGTGTDPAHRSWSAIQGLWQSGVFRGFSLVSGVRCQAEGTTDSKAREC